MELKTAYWWVVSDSRESIWSTLVTFYHLWLMFEMDMSSLFSLVNYRLHVNRTAV